MTVMCGPGQVLGKAGGLQPFAQVPEPREVSSVQPTFATDAEADAVYGNREPFRQVTQLGQWPPAIAHVVLGVDFQPFDRARIVQDGGEMLWFVTNAGTG